MINVDRFRWGMDALGIAFKREITPEVLEVFGGVIAEDLSDAEWTHAVKQALTHERFFPVPAILLEYGHDVRPSPESLQCGRCGPMGAKGPLCRRCCCELEERDYLEKRQQLAATRWGPVGVPAQPIAQPIAKMMPPPVLNEKTYNARMEELRKQAADIQRKQDA
jgi:hypothetical protein